MSRSRRPSADDRTLLLSVPQLTPELLEALIAYQRRLASGPAPQHQAALEESGLDGRLAGPISAMVRDFCGRRSVLARLRRRRGELAGSASPEKLARLDEELARGQDLGPLQSRYGAQNVALLLGREEELLALHARLYQ